MNLYINTETLQYPLFQGDIRLVTGQHEGEFVLTAPFEEVVQTPYPEMTTRGSYALQLPPKLIDGKWVQTWSEVQQQSEKEIEDRLKELAYPITKHNSIPVTKL